MYRPLLILLFVFSPTLLFAEGLYIFKKNCLNCHGKEARMIHPVDKARIQWDRFFRRNIHNPELNISETEKREVLLFLNEHAADSDQPMVPGL